MYLIFFILLIFRPSYDKHAFVYSDSLALWAREYMCVHVWMFRYCAYMFPLRCMPRKGLVMSQLT